MAVMTLPPNPTKLTTALRHLGYETYAALADIIDNSLDAEAQNVSIHGTTLLNDDAAIYIADDGYGMDLETVGEAIRVGSDTDKQPGQDMGRFGMGLVTASLSIARHLAILSRDENGPVVKAVQDLDIMFEKNDWVYEVDIANEEDVKLFEQYVHNNGKHGTLIVLKKIDHICTKNVTHFRDGLVKRLGLLFHKYIEAHKNITVNGKKVNAFDPLFWGSKGTKHLLDEEIEIEIGKDENGKAIHDTVRIRLAYLDEEQVYEAGESANNTQGFYVDRNNRVLNDKGTWFDWKQKHTTLSHLRGSISFTGTSDHLFGVTFMKNKVVMDQSVRDAIGHFACPIIKQVGADWKNKELQKAKPEVEAMFKKVADDIKKNNHLLIKPKAKGEEHKPALKEGKPKEDPKKSSKAKKGNANHLVDSEKVKWELHNFTANGPIYDSELKGHHIVIQMNADHPFYEKCIAGADEKTARANAFMIYSWAVAEQNYYNPEDDKSRELIENIRTVWSQNMKTLLNNAL
jgi:hypothetical protein